MVPALPDRADGVDDELAGQAARARDPRLARGAAAQLGALGQELRPGRAVDGAVDAPAAGWEGRDFNDTSWKSSDAAFGTPEQVYRSGALEEAFGVKISRSMAENGWHYYYL